MTEQENILRLAREAFEFDMVDNHCYVQSDFVQQDGCYIDDDVDFAWQATLAVVIAILPAIGEMVKAETVAETQEACARVCEKNAYALGIKFKEVGVAVGAMECGKAIRAMAETPSQEGEA